MPGRSLPALLCAGLLAIMPAAHADDVSPAPSSQISGTATRMADITDLVVSPSGERIVTDLQADAVLVFAPGARGNATPTRVISGSTTGILNPQSVTVASDGTIFVGQVGPGTPGTASIRVFAPGASGDVAPIRVIAGSITRLAWPAALALDNANHLLVANRTGGNIAFFAADATGNVAPLWTLSGSLTGLSTPESIALATDGTIYVGDSTASSVSAFGPQARGNVRPGRTWVGSATQIDEPTDLALDAENNIYVANADTTGGQAGDVLVISARSSGDTAPVRRVTGAATRISTPTGIAVDSQERFLVGSTGATPALLSYDAVLTISPGAVGALRVSGAATAKNRTVSWTPPTSGGAPSAYTVTVAKAGRRILATTTTATSATLRRSKLPRGSLTVTVTPANSAGPGPASHVDFTVR